MDNLISIIIEAVDHASDTIKKVGASVTANQANFKSMAVAGGIAFGALTGVIMKSVASAQESQMVHAQLEAVLKSTGGTVGLTAEQIEAHSSALQKSLGISDEVIATGQNMLLTFTNIGKNVFPGATETLLDMATAMNGGLAPSAEQLKGSAIQLGKALNDPIAGISALSRVGVTFTDQQKKNIEAMVAMGDTAGAQKLILAELNKEFGGSAKAQSETFAGSMAKLKVSFGDIFENIGMALIPSLQKLAEAVTPVIQRISEWATQNPELITKILAIGMAVSGLVFGIGTLGALMPAITAGLSAVGAVLAFIFSPIGLVVAGVVALGIAWKTNFLGIQDITASVWEWIKTTFQAGVDWIMATIEPFLIELRKFWDENGAQIMAGLQIFWEGVKIVFTEVFEWMKTYLGTAWEVITAIFGTAFSVIKGAFEVFFELISGVLTAGMQLINGDWSGAWDTVKNTFSSIGETIITTGKEIFERLNTTIAGIVEKIENYVKGALTRIKNVLKEIVTLGMADTSGGGEGTKVAGARARGGSVFGGSSYLVGEEGPEIFTAPRSGTIIPNDQIGGGVTISINFGGVSVRNDQDIKTMTDMISDELARKLQLNRLGIAS